MAEQKVMGVERVISITLPGGTGPILLGCEVDHNFDRSRDVITADSKCGPSRLPNPNLAATIQGNGQVLKNDAGGDLTTKVTEAKIDQLLRNATFFDWVMGPKSGTPEPGDVVYSGRGWFSALNSAFNTDGVATFDFTIQVDGDYTQEIEPAA
ncbi:hypothetical protein ACE38W_14515 [Chitinophaga sp. Hz27]|uniref:hypothetical protein n=1 Tax=Chitinophaga sp. Hz27 TaxID=3347169 RepID=UPI0035D5EDC4